MVKTRILKLKKRWPLYLLLVPVLVYVVLYFAVIFAFDEPHWSAEPKVNDAGTMVFEPFRTFHPAHLTTNEILYMLIFEQDTFEQGFKMLIKDLSLVFSDNEEAADIGDERLDAHYENTGKLFETKLPVGTLAPDFALTTTDGGLFRLSDHLGKPVVFMFVAMTCPPALIQRDRWALLEDKYASEEVKFVMVYSIEQHPGEKAYREFVEPQNFQQKMEYAKMFSDKTNIEVAVDSFDRTVLSTYNSLANPVFVIDSNGMLAFKSTWADTNKIEVVLDTLLSR